MKAALLVLLVALVALLGGHGHAHSHSHDHGHSHSHSHSNDAAVDSHNAPPSLVWTWVVALSSTAVIGTAPVLVLLLLPVISGPKQTQQQHDTLKVLLGFAIGGLLGDVFLHLLPHVVAGSGGGESSHSHTHSHGGAPSDGTTVGLFTIAGILAFFTIEKVIRMASSGHSHSHEHADEDLYERTQEPVHTPTTRSSARLRSKAAEKAAPASKTPSNNTTPEIAAAAYLNLAADFAHNFTDGLAVGASFQAGHSLGIITVVAVLCHEVPHEIGDFAILVQSGVSRRSALLLQLLTAVGAMLGTVTGLVVEGEAGSGWIMPFTAGGFIYVATVTVMPELLQKSTAMQSVKELMAIAAGVALMYAVGLLEHMG